MKNIFLSSIYLVTLFSLSRFIFEPTYLYYEIWWLDIPMHILGGAGIYFFVYSIFSYKNKNTSFKKVIFYTIVICLIWEMYEYLRGANMYLDLSDYLDSVKDLINGIIGGAIAFFFVKK